LTYGIVLDLSQPLKETTAMTQVRAKHVIATAKHATIMTSSRPCLIAATVSSDVLNMNTKPPHAKKNPARASVGGRLGSVERGGPNHRKKYVKHRMTANPASKLPHKAWIWTWKTYGWK